MRTILDSSLEMKSSTVTIIVKTDVNLIFVKNYTGQNELVLDVWGDQEVIACRMNPEMKEQILQLLENIKYSWLIGY